MGWKLPLAGPAEPLFRPGVIRSLSPGGASELRKRARLATMERRAWGTRPQGALPRWRPGKYRHVYLQGGSLPTQATGPAAGGPALRTGQSAQAQQGRPGAQAPGPLGTGIATAGPPSPSSDALCCPPHRGERVGLGGWWPPQTPSPASLGPRLQVIWTHVTPSGSDSGAQARLPPGALPQCSLAFLPTATTLSGCRRTPHRAHNRQLSIPSSREQPEETGWVLPGWGATEQRPCWVSSPHPGMTLVLGPPSAGLSSQLACWPFPGHRPTLAHVGSQGHRTGQDGAVGSPVPRDWGTGPAGHPHSRKVSARLPRRERWSAFNIGRLGVNPVLPKVPE